MSLQTKQRIDRELRFMRAARRLLDRRFVVQEKNPGLFEDIVRQKDELASYFGKIGGELLVSPEQGIAALRDATREEADTESGDRIEGDEGLPGLGGKPMTLRPLAMAALIWLKLARSQFMTAGDSSSSLPVVDGEDLRAYLDTYQDRVKAKKDREWQKKIRDALDQLLSLDVLLTAKGTGDREVFLVTAVVDLLISPDRVAELTAKLQDWRERGGAQGAAAADEDAEEDT